MNYTLIIAKDISFIQGSIILTFILALRNTAYKQTELDIGENGSSDNYFL